MSADRRALPLPVVSAPRDNVIPLHGRGQCRDCLFYIPPVSALGAGGVQPGECFYSAEDPATEPPPPWPDVRPDFSCRFFEKDVCP